MNISKTTFKISFRFPLFRLSLRRMVFFSSKLRFTRNYSSMNVSFQPLSSFSQYSFEINKHQTSQLRIMNPSSSSLVKLTRHQKANSTATKKVAVKSGWDTIMDPSSGCKDQSFKKQASKKPVPQSSPGSSPESSSKRPDLKTTPPRANMASTLVPPPPVNKTSKVATPSPPRITKTTNKFTTQDRSRTITYGATKETAKFQEPSATKTDPLFPAVLFPPVLPIAITTAKRKVITGHLFMT